MALAVKTKINTYDVEAYRVIEHVVFQKPSGSGGKGVFTVRTNDLPSRDLADNPNVRFNPLDVVIAPVPTKAAPVQTPQANGTTLITPMPDLPAYGDLIGAPIGTWAKLPDGVSTLEEWLAQVSLHELVFQLAYQVARLVPQTRDATDI